MKYRLIALLLCFSGLYQTANAACFFMEYTIWQIDILSGSSYFVTEVSLVCIPDYVAYITEDEDVLVRYPESTDERDERVLVEVNNCYTAVVQRAVDACWDREHDRPLNVCSSPLTMQYREALVSPLRGGMSAEHPIIVEGKPRAGRYYRNTDQIEIDVRSHENGFNRDRELFNTLIHERLHRHTWNASSPEAEEAIVRGRSWQVQAELEKFFVSYASCAINWNHLWKVR